MTQTKQNNQSRHPDLLTGHDFRVDEPLGPLRAIRAKCRECMRESAAEIKECTIYGCALWPWRSGHSPNRKPRIMTEEQKLAAADRLRKARESRKSIRTQ